MLHRTLKRTGGGAAAFALAAAGLAFTATPARAQDINIDTWRQATCSFDGYLLCLWYHPGQGTGGAGWGTNVPAFDIDNANPPYFFLDGSPNNDGYHQGVRNNAGSMSNGSTNCLDYAFISPAYSGNPDNVLGPGWGGNLSPELHNNEASVTMSC